MNERVVAAIVAAALFAVVGLLISEHGQSRIAGVFPMGTPHYIYKRAALTVLIMAIAGVQAVLRLPVVLGFSDPALYKSVPFDPWQAVLFILLLYVFLTPVTIKFTSPTVTIEGGARSVVMEDDDTEQPSEDDGWEDAQVLSAEEVLRRAKRTNEIHIGRGASSQVAVEDED